MSIRLQQTGKSAKLIEVFEYAEEIGVDILSISISLPQYSDVLEHFLNKTDMIIYAASPEPNYSLNYGFYDHPKTIVVGDLTFNNTPNTNSNQNIVDKWWRIGHNAVFTNDYEGDLGENLGDYTNSFGGTSAATPIYAGIKALQLGE